MASVILKKGREKSLMRKHPWVFSGAVKTADKGIASGDIVTVRGADGRFLARGSWSPHSQIRVRIWSFNPKETIDEAFIHQRIAAATAYRDQMAAFWATDAYRIINGESDGMPGLIVDKYGDFLVCQFMSVAVESFKPAVIKSLRSFIPCRGIFERSDGAVRTREGLEPITGVLAGETPPPAIHIMENGRHFEVDVHTGHKTGYYLDQRDNRLLLARMSPGKDVLNCFSYTGGFGLFARTGGASSVVNADISKTALAQSRRNLEANGFSADSVEHVAGDVFALLRAWRDEGRTFDIVVLDPPKFAESAAQISQAARGYKDINWLGFRLLRPGGLLFTFSCSGAMQPDLFQKIVADAALDARRNVRMISWLTHGADHPVCTTFPEGHYLKGLLCRAD
ncbi:MAG: 23S rRNA (cytosine(1962)-C(5))-methyltransferase RlmI [Deltaproteobacteria bacterium]|nr:MAG: 23S rRNA (cytosine(1962)-C(5))-methyltransferase RlmI [Deltaproteobacteria bacterium]